LGRKSRARTKKLTPKENNELKLLYEEYLNDIKENNLEYNAALLCLGSVLSSLILQFVMAGLRIALLIGVGIAFSTGVGIFLLIGCISGLFAIHWRRQKIKKKYRRLITNLFTKKYHKR
jgi:hypothetical protein